jgi:hypothetical protein
MTDEPLLLEHVPSEADRYKVSRGRTFLGWIEHRDGWWYGDGPTRAPLPGRHRLRRDALARLTQVNSQ